MLFIILINFIKVYYQNYEKDLTFVDAYKDGVLKIFQRKLPPKDLKNNPDICVGSYDNLGCLSKLDEFRFYSVYKNP